MFYDSLGDPQNPTVIFLNGGGEAFSFARQYGFQDRFYLIIPHLPGTGEESEAEYSLRACTDGVLALIGALGRPTVTLVGFSLGAQLVIPIACAAPQRIGGAVMVSPWILKPEREVKRISRLLRLTAPLERSAWFNRQYCRRLGLDEAQTQAHLSYARRARRDYMRRVIQDGVDIEKFPAFAALEIPMLALCGEKEPRIMKDSVLELQKRNPHCAARILPGHAHDIPSLRPEKFNHILETWLTENHE
jgi:Predicted hydrolases or acyltransferases (alpha/beta hydrolase superfamily)